VLHTFAHLTLPHAPSIHASLRILLRIRDPQREFSSEWHRSSAMTSRCFEILAWHTRSKIEAGLPKKDGNKKWTEEWDFNYFECIYVKSQSRHFLSYSLVSSMWSCLLNEPKGASNLRAMRTRCLSHQCKYLVMIDAALGVSQTRSWAVLDGNIFVNIVSANVLTCRDWIDKCLTNFFVQCSVQDRFGSYRGGSGARWRITCINPLMSHSSSRLSTWFAYHNPIGPQ